MVTEIYEASRMTHHRLGRQVQTDGKHLMEHKEILFLVSLSKKSGNSHCQFHEKTLVQDLRENQRESRQVIVFETEGKPSNKQTFECLAR